MLQIISKKFFKSDDPNSYYETDEKAIVYSNLGALNKIETPVANLERIESYKGVTAYLMTYKNRLEKQQSSSQLVSVGHTQIVNDFLCCCTLWFSGIFTTDKFYLEKLTRTQKEGVGDSELPNKIAPKFFELNQNISKSEAEKFNNFMNNIIGLKREKYCEVMKVVRQYQDAVVTLNSNMELSYTMFVAAIESLAQKFDGFKTEWKDCPENIVKKFDILFDELEVGKIESIKKIIIEDTHNRLARRFESFCLNHIDLNFFRGDAIGVENPIRKSHLIKAIKSSYILRSKYVHTLKELPDMMKLVGRSEMYIDEKNVYLTFSGISRMSRYIVKEFIEKSKNLEREEYNYFDDLPGMLKMRMAPQYWIHNPDVLSFDRLDEYTNSFLSYYTKVRVDKSDIAECSVVCKKVEEMLTQASNDFHKQKLLLVYVLYNDFLSVQFQVEDWHEVFRKYEKIMDDISLESLLLHLMTFNDLPWSITEIISCYDDYNKKRFWKQGLKLPQIIEVCILLEISNMYLIKDDRENASIYIKKAIEEKPGDQYLIEVSEHIKSSDIKIIDWKKKYFDIEINEHKDDEVTQKF